MSGALPEHIDDIEAFYKDNLENLQAAPSMDLWERIDAALPAEPPSLVVQQPPVNPLNKPFWWAGAGLGMVAVALFIYRATSVPEQKVKAAQNELKQVDSVAIEKPSTQSNSAPALSPTNTDVEKQKDFKENTQTLDHANENSGVVPPEQVSPSPSAEALSPEPKPQLPLPPNHVDTVAIQQKAETPVEKEAAKKTMHEKLKEKNGSKANDLFIKKKD